MQCGTTIQPIPLLLLDINMPRLSGLEACKLIKKKYSLINSRALKQPEVQLAETLVMRPFICFVTQQEFGTMRQFITEEEQADCYLEKPLAINQLISLLRILNIL